MEVGVGTVKVGGGIKIRSPFHAVTDWIYCPEPLGSPRKGLLDFISPQKKRVFVTIFFKFVFQLRKY